MPRHVTIDTVDPVAAPESVGAHWVNEASGDHFLSNGTASVANWVKGGGDAGGGGGGGGGGSNTETFQYAFFQPGAGADAVTMLSSNFGRTWTRTPALESSQGTAMPNPKIGAQLGQPSKLMVMVDRTANYILKVSLDAGATWEELGGPGGWAPNPLAQAKELFAGYDSRNEYLVATVGSFLPFDLMFSYDGTAWSARFGPGGILALDGINDLQGGLADAFFLYENNGGTYNILKSIDIGVNWTTFVGNFDGGQVVTAMGIDPTIGMGIGTSSDELWVSADGVAVPTLFAGSSAMIGFTPMAIFGGNGKLIVFGSNGAASSRVFCYDGTTLQEGAILAYDQTLSSPDPGRANGRPIGVECYWDGDGYAAFVRSFTGGSAESAPMWMRSEDGLIWVADPFRRPSPGNTYALDQNQWAVIAQ